VLHKDRTRKGNSVSSWWQGLSKRKETVHKKRQAEADASLH